MLLVIRAGSIQIPTLRASDADFNGMDQLTFSILPGAPFFLSSDGQTLTTTMTLDRESLMAQFYTITGTIQVSDSGGNTNTATLNITVSDVNDNPPMFLPSSTTFSVEEGRVAFPDPMSFVGTVLAVDPDRPDDPQITYFLSDGDMGDFRIDPQTGEIFVIGQINIEAISMYVLTVTATDGLLTSEQDITIVILERNDNDPIFVRNPFLGNVIENAGLDTRVDENFTMTGVALQVLATDLDVIHNITYSILPQPGLPVPFRVNPLSGLISTNATLDREATDRYSFTVQAHDGLRSSESLVEIFILDSNDEAPVFVTDAINVTIPELTPANFVFLFVEATDNDIGTNADITYSIIETQPPIVSGLFNVSALGGAVFASRQIIIDENDPLLITLRIGAFNSPLSLPPNAPVPMAEAVVTIAIEPQNINAPQFDPPHYTFTVRENQVGSLLGHVVATEPSGDVGTLITYSILNSSVDASHFSVDPMVSTMKHVFM